MAPELGVLVLGRGYKWLQYFLGGKIFSSVPVYSFDERSYEEEECLFQYYEFHGPLIRFFGVRAGLLLLYRVG